MDIFSHAIWGATTIRKKPLVYWAALSGIAPDILGSGPGFLYLLFFHRRLWSTATWSILLPWMRDNYHLWHSLWGVQIFLVALSFLAARSLILVLPYLLHIFIDLLTHQGDMGYRLFFPFVQYDANGVKGMNWWENSWMVIVNAGLLILINGFIWLRKAILRCDQRLT